MSFRLLHISDTHFGTTRPAVLAALQNHVKAHGANLLVVSGDLTQRARRRQFAAAADYLRTLEGLGIHQRLIIPGNHDLPLFNLLARFLTPYGNYQRHFGDELEPVFANDQLLVIGLNTTAPKRHKNGLVSDQQIEQVAARLALAAPWQTRILVAHQPFGSREPGNLADIQINAHRALQRWAEAGLDLVMGGHLHLPYVLPLNRQYPDLARPIWIVQCGTTLSSRRRHGQPNSLNRLTIKGRGQVQVEQWDFHQDAFVLVKQSELNG